MPRSSAAQRSTSSGSPTGSSPPSGKSRASVPVPGAQHCSRRCASSSIPRVVTSMGNQHFLLGRRRIDEVALADFVRTLRFHGALGFRDDSAGGLTDEQARLNAVPLVFGLIPTNAVVRRRVDERINLAIRQHLSVVGVPVTDVLVDVLKAVSDQFWATWPVTNEYGNTRRLRKSSMADLRANPSLYRRIRQAQGFRCAVCGLVLEAPGEETLDHMVPFRIIGDVPDGANWQILCRACNSGKGERFSALQSLEALNWAYRDAHGAYARRPSLETRYLVLARARGLGLRRVPRGSSRCADNGGAFERDRTLDRRQPTGCVSRSRVGRRGTSPQPLG